MVPRQAVIPQVEMVATLLHADDFQPRRCLRKELRARDHAGALPLYIPASELRSHCEKEFVDAAVRHKVSEKSRTSFVEQELHREFIAEEFQDRGRSNFAFRAFHCPHFSRGERATPFLSSNSLPLAEVRIRVFTPGVRNTAL